MTTTATNRQQTRPPAADQPQTGRRIGRLGTAARLVVGAVLLGFTVATQASQGLQPLAWILGLAALPAVVVAGVWLRSQRFPESMRATGPLGLAANGALIVALAVPSAHVPTLRAITAGVVIFYAASMLLAAARRYTGCEVVAISNWLLRRDDRVGCVLFSPVDRLEAAAARLSNDATSAPSQDGPDERSARAAILTTLAATAPPERQQQRPGPRR